VNDFIKLPSKTSGGPFTFEAAILIMENQEELWVK
jgi:hypothetical protein